MDSEALEQSAAILDQPSQDQPSQTPILRYENITNEAARSRLHEFLLQPGWRHGWKSNRRVDHYSFWNKHFAGSLDSSHEEDEFTGEIVDCSDELAQNYPLIHAFWTYLHKTVLRGHILVRCYANGYPYGTEGTVHTDASASTSYTSIFYPHDRWSPNWGGETVFFNSDRSDLVASIYPKPNRLIVFPGAIPHAARGVSRVCPVLRVTLMFKTEHLG